MIQAGSILWHQGDPAIGLLPHWFFVLSDPMVDFENILLVAMTSEGPGKRVDEACRLVPGDHPLVTKNSFLYYREPIVMSMDKIEAKIWDGGMRIDGAVEATLLKRMRAGARDSDFIPKMHHRFLEQQGLFVWPYVP